MYAVFCVPKGKSRAVDGPCLDPLDFGLSNEPMPEHLLRRGRVGLFASEREALDALKATLQAGIFREFQKQHEFVILECLKRSFSAAHQQENHQ